MDLDLTSTLMQSGAGQGSRRRQVHQRGGAGEAAPGGGGRGGSRPEGGGSRREGQAQMGPLWALPQVRQSAAAVGSVEGERVS